MIGLVWLLACSSPPSAASGGAAPTAAAPIQPAPAAPAESESLTTRAGHYRIRWAALPAPIPFNALFSIRTVVTDASGAPVTTGTVTVDASMPQHGHGMPTHPVADPGSCSDATPSVCSHPDGVYLSNGMKFHMQGEWVIHFDVTGPAGSDTLDVHYTL